jgi:myo-inositol-1(or 4)-monophosphatase
MAAPDDETRQVLALATRLAREAGALQRERYEAEHQIDTKSAAVDLVTEVDHACEELVVGSLERERPDDAIVAEEGRGTDHPGARWRWIVDPLDGTTNYAHSYPRFCVSLGVERDGAPQVGVVYDPLLDELYHAVAGDGAFRNDRPIRVSRETRLDRSLLATGFAYDRRQSEEDNVAEFAAFLRQARALRRDGSAALDLCYVACGRLDGYWEFKLQPWDVAAGGLIVAEAGGRVSDLDGGDGYRRGEQVVSSNGAIHAAMIQVLREHRDTAD